MPQRVVTDSPFDLAYTCSLCRATEPEAELEPVSDVVEVVDDVVLEVVDEVVVLAPVVEVLDELSPVELRYAVHRPYRLSPFANPWSTPLVSPFLEPASAAALPPPDALGSGMFVEPDALVEAGMEIPTFESDPDNED